MNDYAADYPEVAAILAAAYAKPCALCGASGGRAARILYTTADSVGAYDAGCRWIVTATCAACDALPDSAARAEQHFLDEIAVLHGLN